MELFQTFNILHESKHNAVRMQRKLLNKHILPRQLIITNNLKAGFLIIFT